MKIIEMNGNESRNLVWCPSSPSVLVIFSVWLRIVRRTSWVPRWPKLWPWLRTLDPFWKIQVPCKNMSESHQSLNLYTVRRVHIYIIYIIIYVIIYIWSKNSTWVFSYPQRVHSFVALTCHVQTAATAAAKERPSPLWDPSHADRPYVGFLYMS